MTHKNKRCAPSAGAAECVRLATQGEAQCQTAVAVPRCHVQVLCGDSECGDASKRQPDHVPEPVQTRPVFSIFPGRR